MTTTAKVQTIQIQIAAEAIRREETGKSLTQIGKDFGVSGKTVSRYADKFNDEALDYIEEHYNTKLDEVKAESPKEPESQLKETEEEQSVETEDTDAESNEDQDSEEQVDETEPEPESDSANDDGEEQEQEQQEDGDSEEQVDESESPKPMSLAQEIALKIKRRKEAESQERKGVSQKPTQEAKEANKDNGTGRGRRITSQRQDVIDAMDKIRSMKGEVLSASNKVMPFPTSVALEEYLDANGDRDAYVEKMKARGYSGSSIQQGWFRADAYLGEENK